MYDYQKASDSRYQLKSQLTKKHLNPVTFLCFLKLSLKCVNVCVSGF